MWGRIIKFVYGRKKMRLLWCVLPFFMSSVTCGDETFTDTHMVIALSVARHLKISFCVIGIQERHKGLHLITRKVYPSKKRMLTSELTMEEISKLLSRDDDEQFLERGRTIIILKMTNSTVASLRQISNKSRLSSVAWLLFADHPRFHPELFQDIYIPFDCEFIYVTQIDTYFSMTELYRIKRGSRMETHPLGHWTKEDGLRLSPLHLYARRYDLGGHTFKALLRNDPPYVSIRKDHEGKPKYRGYIYEIWNELEFRLNFRTEFPEYYFDKNPEEVLKGEDVDFAVARIPNEPSAFLHMDFSQPVHEAKFYMFGHRPGSELDWDSYLKPFSPNTWVVSLVWMLASSVALAVLYRKAWDFGTSEREAKYFIFSFSESLLTVFRAICMQGSDVTPKSISCRLFFLSIYLTALVVTSAFSAALFSLLTIPKPRSPFNSLEEVLSNKRYKISFPSDPKFHKLVENFSSTLLFSNQVKLLERLVESKDTLPVTLEDGLRRLCHDKFFVFMFDLPNVLYLMQNMTKACQDKILPSGPPLFTSLVGFGFKKNNPYKKLIDFHLIRMKNEGILSRLLLTHLPPQIPTVQATWVRVTVADISPILYMFALGAILGALILYAEKILLHLRKKKSNFRSTVLSDRSLLNQQISLSGYSNSRMTPIWELFYRKSDKRSKGKLIVSK